LTDEALTCRTAFPLLGIMFIVKQNRNKIDSSLSNVDVDVKAMMITPTTRPGAAIYVQYRWRTITYPSSPSFPVPFFYLQSIAPHLSSLLPSLTSFPSFPSTLPLLSAVLPFYPLPILMGSAVYSSGKFCSYGCSQVNFSALWVQNPAV
jgi:hypothetical protein